MGALGPLVDIHSNAIHQMHSNPRFLPWHRIYLLRMEELLMSVDPTVCIPYWKSSEEQAFPSWLLGFTPTVTLMGGPHTVTRNIGAFAILPNAAAVAAAMANGTFNTFAPAVEGVHNSGHVWVGGSMGSITTAPCRPGVLDAPRGDRSDLGRMAGGESRSESGARRRRGDDGSVDRDRAGHQGHHGSRLYLCLSEYVTRKGRVSIASLERHECRRARLTPARRRRRWKNGLATCPSATCAAP